jgi:hypothetical protein
MTHQHLHLLPPALPIVDVIYGSPPETLRQQWEIYFFNSSDGELDSPLFCSAHSLTASHSMLVIKFHIKIPVVAQDKTCAYGPASGETFPFAFAAFPHMTHVRAIKTFNFQLAYQIRKASTT